jgi:hypothetical protein
MATAATAVPRLQSDRVPRATGGLCFKKERAPVMDRGYRGSFQTARLKPPKRVLQDPRERCHVAQSGRSRSGAHDQHRRSYRMDSRRRT